MLELCHFADIKAISYKPRFSDSKRRLNEYLNFPASNPLQKIKEEEIRVLKDKPEKRN